MKKTPLTLSPALLLIGFLGATKSGVKKPFIGEIKTLGGNFTPREWALSNGQLLAIHDNSALFSIIGTTYGGDGETTFALPNLQGRVPVHAGDGPDLSFKNLGECNPISV